MNPAELELDVLIGDAVARKDFVDLRHNLALMKKYYPARYSVWRETLMYGVQVGRERIKQEEAERNTDPGPVPEQ